MRDKQLKIQLFHFILKMMDMDINKTESRGLDAQLTITSIKLASCPINWFLHNSTSLLT